MLSDSPYVTAKPAQVIDDLSRIVQVYYGTNPDNLPEGFLSSCYKAISDRFVGITVSDVVTAYSIQEIEKKPFVSLTRDELVEPVKNYWHKKINLLTEVETERREQAVSIAKQLRRIAFWYRSEILFLDCFEKGEWTGDAFQAAVLCRVGLASSMDQEIKNNLWIESQNEFKESRAEISVGLQEISGFMLISAEHRLAQKLTQYICLNRLPYTLRDGDQ